MEDRANLREHTALDNDPEKELAIEYIEDVFNEYDKNEAEFAYYLEWLAEDYAVKDLEDDEGTPGANSFQELIDETDTDDPTDASWDEFKLGVIICLFRYHHYLKDLHEAQNLLEDYSDEFSDCPNFKCLEIEINSSQGGEDSFDEALESAFNLSSEYSNYPEVQHRLAMVTSKALVKEYEYTGEAQNISTDPDDLLHTANLAAQKTLDDNRDWPKYYTTKSRILALRGKYEEAENSLWNAINSVDRNRPDPAWKINSIRSFFGTISMIKQRAYIESKTEEVMETAFEEIEDQARQYQIPIIQFLVFFTGLLAVVIIASDIVFTVESLNSAIQLLLIMMGGLLISFGSFSLLLPETPTTRTSAMIGIGFILLIIVIIISI